MEHKTLGIAELLQIIETDSLVDETRELTEEVLRFLLKNNLEIAEDPEGFTKKIMGVLRDEMLKGGLNE